MKRQLQIKKQQLLNKKPAKTSKKKVEKEKAAGGGKIKIKREKLDDDSSVDSFIDSDDNSINMKLLRLCVCSWKFYYG